MAPTVCYDFLFKELFKCATYNKIVLGVIDNLSMTSGAWEGVWGKSEKLGHEGRGQSCLDFLIVSSIDLMGLNYFFVLSRSMQIRNENVNTTLLAH